MSVSASPDNYEGDWSQTEPRSPVEHASKRRRTASFRHHENQETGLMRDSGNPGLPRFVGSSSGIHFVRTVYGILSRSTGQQLSVSQLVPGEDDQLEDAHESVGANPATPGTGARAPFWQPDEVIASGNPMASSVTFEALIAWTKSYFEIWHPVFPFLHGPEVVEILEQVANNGLENISPQDSAIVRAIISISLADSRQLGTANAPGPGPVPLDLVFFSLDHVASSLHFILGTPASLKNMQAALCVELFLLLTLLSKHAQIRGMILELRHKSLHVRQDTLDRSLHVQSKLTRWTNDVHDALTGDHTDDEDQPGHAEAAQPGNERTPPLYNSLLLVLQHESTIALNRPLLAKTPRTSASQAALEACIGASRAILETIDMPGGRFEFLASSPNGVHHGPIPVLKQ
ncbi:hypothetical protein SLS64_001267 [Diaporthe eres]